VLVIGHIDTVWPEHTLRRWPLRFDGDTATGPGVFDMKAGLVQALFAIASLPERDGIELLVTSDEELGSPQSRSIIEQRAQAATAVLVVEPSLDGALKTARKGSATYALTAIGRSAHAGLDPHEGVNATVELAHHIGRITQMGRHHLGTTITPTTVTAGSASNQVPERGSVMIDVRASSTQELMGVDRSLRALQPYLAGITLQLDGEIACLPFGRTASRGLFDLASECAAELGIGRLEEVCAGGSSDANFAAAAGTPTLDGLGAVGGGAHAEGEWVDLAAMPDRAALLHQLMIRALCDGVA
jgi:glutamate carboxypeptidase